MANNRICAVCGTQYDYCPTCRKYENLPKWSYMFHSEECHEVFGVIREHAFGRATADDVRAILQKYHVTDYSKYVENIQKSLHEILDAPVEEPVDIPAELVRTWVPKKNHKKKRVPSDVEIV